MIRNHQRQFVGGLAALVMALSVVSAQDNYRKKDTWQETLQAYVAAENGTGEKPPERNWKPFRSRPLAVRDNPQSITVDIEGQPYLTLEAKASEGSNRKHDKAVWEDAKLTTIAGEAVWLDTLKPVRVTAGFGGMTIGLQKKRAIIAPTHSILVYKLDPAKKFKTFTANVWIYSKGEAQFFVHNRIVDTGSPADRFWLQLARDFPKDQNRIMIVRDFLRRSQLPLAAPDADFAPQVQSSIAFAEKTIDFLKKAKIDTSTFASELKSLKSKAGSTKDLRDLYLDVCMLRRKMIFSHPALDFDRILCNVNPPTTFSHNGDQHLGRHSRIGPGITVLSDWKNENPRVTHVLKDKLPPGATRSPDLHYDAEKVTFAFCDHREENRESRRFFLWEAAIDGSWVRQITGTNRDKLETMHGLATVMVEDNDPCYLPDEDIIFISTRCQSFGRCHGARYNPAWVLYRCDRNGENVTQLSFNNENEYEPAVLNDGRIIFCRWEYTNRNERWFHMLWWCRPDGTNVSHFFGNDMYAPHMITEATAIQGSHKVVATCNGHHSYSTGTVIVLDTNKGENTEDAVTHITPETPYPETTKNKWPEPHYSHPCPVTEQLFLVSRANHRIYKQGMLPPANNRGIYLIDSIGGRELIYEHPDCATFSPIAVRKRKRPPVLPSMLPPSPKEEKGTLFVQNAYLTRNDPDGIIKPGMIKAIRVIGLGIKPKPGTSCSMTVTVEIPKKVIGTVPVDADGSAVFTVPANTSLQLQILDKNGMAILTEKSFFYLHPGEQRSCIGCHEPIGTAPIKAVMAKNALKKPMELKPGAGPQYPGGLSFMRTVQPVLDRYCIKCHGLDKTEKKVNLIHDGKLKWPASARELITRGDHRVGELRYMNVFERNISRPRRFYAYRNKVSHMLLKNHGKCNMDKDSYMRIIEWFDLNAQILPDNFNNYLESRKIDNDVLKQLRAYAAEIVGSKIASQPERALINVAQPDESRILMMPLATEAGGWGQVTKWQSKDDPGYKKMAKLVDKCIIRRPDENTRGWKPTIEAGGSEKWVLQERKKFRERKSD